MRKIILFPILLISLCYLQAQPTLYGVSGNGSGNSVLSKYTAGANSLTAVHTFEDMGSNPNLGLVEGADGKYYGVFPNTGKYNSGFIYSFDPLTSIYTKVKEFNNNSPVYDGSNPNSEMVKGNDGKLYGITQTGGTSGAGVIYCFDPLTGIYSKKRDLNYADGGYASNSCLYLSADGSFYGMGQSGGANGYGAIFRFNPVTLVYTVLYSLEANDGRYSYGRFAQIGNKLYGSTGSGGANGTGTIFSFDLVTNVYTKHLDFDANTPTNIKGSYSYSGLTAGANSKLYGTTYQGGANGRGTFFSFDPITLTFTKIRDFNYSDGAYPQEALLLSSDGKLYGVTYQGGNFGYGIIFSFNTSSNTYQIVKHFDQTSGSYPSSTLSETAGGKLISTTNSGGSHTIGVIFSLTLSTSAYTKLYDFKNLEGKEAFGAPAQGPNGKLYGATAQGGLNNYGILYSFDPVTSVYTKLRDFDHATGGNPRSSLLKASNGKLYGMTQNGGTSGVGVIYSFDPLTSTYTKLKDLVYSTGGNPYGNSLIEASNGKFYGMTQYGGVNGNGVIFSFDPNTLLYTKLKDFSQTDGSNSYGSLVQASNGKLYGFTANGGASGYGVFFSFDPVTSVYTKIKEFDYYTNGAYPYSTPVKSADNKLYGMTAGGYNGPTIFSYDPPTNIFESLTSGFGYVTYGSPFMASNNKLYTMSYNGGNFGVGAIYSYNTISNTSNILQSLNYDNGYYPYIGSSFVEVGNCSSLPNAIISTNSPVSNPICQGNNLTLSASGGTSYIWTGPNGFSSTQQNPVINNAAQTAAGLYIVQVSNGDGDCVTTKSIEVGINPKPTGTVSANGSTAFCPSGSVGLSASFTTNSQCIYSANNNCTVTTSICNDGYAFFGNSSVIKTLNTAVAVPASLQFNVYWTGYNNTAFKFYLNGNLIYTGNGTSSTFNCTPAPDGNYPSTFTVAQSAFAAYWNNSGSNTFKVSFLGSNIYVSYVNVNIPNPPPVSYQWSPATGLSNPAISNPLASPTVTTTYTATATSSAGCSASQNITVTIRPQPTVTISPASPINVCNNGTAVLTANIGANSGTITSYQWFKNDIPIDNATSNTYTASQAGNYKVKVVNNFGCETTSTSVSVVISTPIVVTAVASNNGTGPVVPQSMIFSGAGQNVTFIGQGPGAKLTGGRTNIYSNINTNNYGGLWWTFTPIENPRHSSQSSSTGQMVFDSYDPETNIITFTSTANMTWPSVGHTENISTRLRMQLQPYTGTHSGPIPVGLPFVTAGDISLGSLSANYPLIDIKALGSTAAYQVWYIIETASGVPLDVYYGDPAHNSSVGGITVTSQTGSFFSSTLSTCNGGPATVTVTATGGTGPYAGTGVFSASLGEHTYTVTDANGCTGSATISIEPPIPIVVTAVASNSTTGPVVPQSMIFSGAGQNVTFSGQGPGAKLTGGRTNIYSNINTNNYGGLWWTFAPIENPRHSSQGSSSTGQMQFSSYDPVTKIITFTSTVNMIWPSIGHTENVATRLRMQLQPYTGSHSGPIPVGLPFVTAGDISLGSLSANYPLIDIKALGSTAAYQVWYIIETASGIPLDVYYGDPAHNSSVGGITVTSQTGSFFSSTLSTCNGGPATVTVTATGGTGPYAGTGVFSASLGEHTYTVTDANGCTGSATINIEPPTPIIVTAVASNNATGPVVPQTMIFSGAGQNVTFVGQGPGAKLTGGRTNIYSNINTNNYGGLWWTFAPIENPRHSSQGSSSTGQMVFSNYDPVTKIITFTSTANMTWPSVGHTENISTRLRMQLQPYTGTHTGPIPVGLPFVTAGDISLGSLSANYPLIDIKALGSPASYQVWYIIETANGVPLDVYYGDPAHNSSVGGITVTSQTGSFFSSTLSTCNGGPATVTVTATGGTGPYTGTGVFSASLGEHTYTVTDANGCTGSATINVEAENCIELLCVENKAVNADEDVCVATVVNIDPIITPANATVSYKIEKDGVELETGVGSVSGKAFTKGTTTVTYTSVDEPTKSCSFTITVSDNQKPTFICPGNQNVNLTATCQLIVPDLISELTGTDNCGTVTFTQSPVAGTSLASSQDQTHNILITASDGNGNTQTCTFVLTGKDVTKPTFTCPSDQNVNLSGTCQLIVPNLISELIGYDNCGIVTFTQSPLAGASLASSHDQTHNVLITASDGNGNTQTCTVVLTGKDVTKPTFTCPSNQNVNLNATCQLVVPDLITGLTGSDNCGIVTFTQSPLAGASLASSHNQTHNVLITASDGNGNTQTCTVALTGKDVTKPTFTCPSDQNVNLSGTCQLIVPNLISELIGYDNCGIVTFTQSPLAGASLASSHDQTHNVLITASDGNGNTQTCTVVLTGKDVTKPTFTCPSNQNVSLNATCQLVVPDLTTGLTGSDNCGIVTFTQSPLPGASLASSHDQTHNVLITASDGNGNTQTCTVVLTGKDVTKPTFTCPSDQNVNLNGTCQLIVPNLISGLIGYDNCGTVTFTQSPVAGASLASSHSQTHNVLITASDGNGNTQTCTVVLTGKDVTKPTFTCPSNQNVNLNGTCQLIVPNLMGGLIGYDNCGTVTFTQSPLAGASLASSHNQTHIVLITANDGNGNTQTCTVILTGRDVTPPVITCPPSKTVSCDASTLPVNTGSATASDNCGGTPVITYSDVSGQDPDPSHTGYYNYTITRTWKAKDIAYNTNTCIQIITVQDVTKPLITCPADKLNIPFDFEQLYATILTGSATATDNCAANANITIAGTRSDNVSITNQQYPLGQTTVAWTATDPSDNSNGCTQTITVRKRNTAVTYTGDMTDNKICIQYSDIINLQAKLTDNEGLLTPNNISSRTITFQLLSGTTVLRSKAATTNASGVAVDTFKIEQAPGMYSVKTIFAGDAYFNGSNDQDNCEVKQEDVIVEYNGSQYFTTASSTTMVGSVTLAASLNDIDDGSDKRGDIRKAKATFRDGGPGGSVLGSINLPVGLVNPGVLTNGLSATTQNNITLNSNDASSGGKIFQVWVGASDHYTGADAGPTPVTLALPGQDFVTGGGHLVVTNSAGTYAGTLNSKMNFGFTMKWNKSGKNLQGNINIVFRKWQLYNGVWQWRVYQMKSNAVNSMAVVEVGANGQPASGTNPAAFRKAIINTKANLKDVTDPLNNIDLGGNHNLVLDAWDHITANGGVSDKISVTLMSGATNELLFSSSWMSNTTAAQTITGGNINVRNGTSSSSTSMNGITKSNQMETGLKQDEFVVKAYPNPAEHQFTLIVNSDLSEKIEIQLYDAIGRKIQTMNAQANETIRFGEKLKTGIYFAKVVQGSRQQTIRLIKQ